MSKHHQLNRALLSIVCKSTETADIIASRLEELERGNAALRAEVNVTRKNYEEYKTENIALREQLEYAIKAGAKREADLLVMLGKEAHQ